MAYARWSASCAWYVFWMHHAEDDGTPASQRLAIWRAGVESKADFGYADVCDWLARDDFAAVPGSTREDRAALRQWCAQWIRDVDSLLRDAGPG
jgi:hypothetical protein